MRTTKLLISTLLLFCCCLTTRAQEKKVVTGTIKDERGTPLPGVTVKEKGTQNGAMTTVEGAYRLSVNPDATLVLSFVGYISQEVPVNSQSILDVVLKEDKTNLNEVVVTALGLRREQRKLGYAVTELKGSDIAKTNSINPVAALQGKVAGVDISSAAGGPQAAPRIVLRGAKSLNGKDQPIFVVDGVIFENDESDNAVNFGNVLKNLNPDDYESVTVLKGAAATALYGSRALNGAILITTKKGVARKGIGVSVSQTVQFEQVYRAPIDLQNVYGAGTNGVFLKENDGTDRLDWQRSHSFGPKMQGQMVKLPNGQMAPYSAQPDNAKELYQTGKYFNTNVAMEGGSENATFRLSYSHLDNNSVSPNNDFSRNNFSLKTTARISEFLSADAGVTYAVSKTLNPDRQGGDHTTLNIGRKWTYIFPRNYDPAYWSRKENYLAPNNARQDPGAYPGSDYWFGQEYYSWTRREALTTGYFALNGTATDWLKFVLRGNFSNEKTSDQRKEAGSSANFSGSDGLYSVSGVNKTQYTFTGMAMITPKLGKNLEGSLNLGGETWNTGVGDQYNNSSSGGLRMPFIYALSNSVNAPTAKADPLLRKRINSLFFAASLAYKNALFLDVTGRNDWSSALTYPQGGGNNSYFYPSVSGAWEFTQSLKDMLPAVISYGKLRASYAMVGGDTDPYSINTGYYTKEYFQGAGTNNNLPLVNIYNEDVLPNMDLKPSISHNVEIGADVRFFNNRLGFDVAWYKTTVKDQILKLAVPIESGVRDRWINAGSMQNTGIELAINASPVRTTNFSWDLTFNGSRNRNKVISLTEGVDQYELNEDQGVRVIATAGSSYGEIVTNYGYTRADNGMALITAVPGSALPFKFTRGAAVVGNIMPDWNLGLSNTFSYKNWTLGFLVQARIGGDFFSASHQYGSGTGTIKSTLYGRDAANGGITYTDATGRTRDDGMIPEGVFEKGTRITHNGQQVDLGGMTFRDAYEQGYVNPITPYQYYGMIGDWGIGIREASVFDASYVALREVSIGYTLPASLVQRWKMNSLRVQLVGRNLGYLHNALPDHINPESVRNNKTSAFSEYGAVPFIRNMGVTVQVGF